MREAQRAILRCHAMAREAASAEDAALCHAVGQACSVVHTPRHAMGYPIYELTALVRRYGLDGCREAVERRVEGYRQLAVRWAGAWRDTLRRWAAFIRLPAQVPDRTAEPPETNAR